MVDGGKEKTSRKQFMMRILGSGVQSTGWYYINIKVRQGNKVTDLDYIEQKTYLK